jgi:hypothetical protein
MEQTVTIRLINCKWEWPKKGGAPLFKNFRYPTIFVIQQFSLFNICNRYGAVGYVDG